MANIFKKRKFNFTQFVNSNVIILGKRLSLPRLNDAAWLEDTQYFFFLISHTLVRIFFPRSAKFTDKCMEN